MKKLTFAQRGFLQSLRNGRSPSSAHAGNRTGAALERHGLAVYVFDDRLACAWRGAWTLTPGAAAADCLDRLARILRRPTLARAA